MFSSSNNPAGSKREAFANWLQSSKGSSESEAAIARLAPEGSKRAAVISLFRSTVKDPETQTPQAKPTESEDSLDSFVMLSSDRPAPPARDERNVLEQKIKHLERTVTTIEKAFNRETGPINPLPDSYSSQNRIDFLLRLVYRLTSKMVNSKTGEVAEINQKSYEELIRAKDSLIAIKMSLASSSSSSEPEVDLPIDLSDSDKGKEEDVTFEKEASIPEIILPPVLEEEKVKDAVPSPESIARRQELQNQIEKSKKDLSDLDFLINLEKAKITAEEKNEAIVVKQMRGLTTNRPQPNTPEFGKYKTEIEDIRAKLKTAQDKLANHKKRLQEFESNKKELEQMQGKLNNELIEAEKPTKPVTTSEPAPRIEPKEEKRAPSPTKNDKTPISPKQTQESGSDVPTLEQLKGEIKVIIGMIREIQGKKAIKKDEKAIQAEEIKALQDALVGLLVQKQQISVKPRSIHAEPSQNSPSSDVEISRLSLRLDLVDREIRELGAQSPEGIVLESVASEFRRQLMALTAPRREQYQPAEPPSVVEDLIGLFW